jgi:hypothetical protein
MINVKPYDDKTFIEQIKDIRLKEYTRIFRKDNNAWLQTNHKTYSDYLYSSKSKTDFSFNDIRWYGISSPVNIIE